MKQICFLLFIVAMAGTVSAQNSKEIVQKGIEVKRIYQQDFEDGEKTPTIWKEEFYNFRGDLVEIKEYKDQGKTIELWFKYKYDNEGNLIESIEYDPKGQIKEHFVDTFINGFRTERNYYDPKGRVLKKRTYKYELRK